MDSKALNREQLQQLVKFIHSRGFKEDVVVLEILDHFACKVEEVVAQQPTMPFEEAIRQAHASFGVMGFQPIAASFAESTRKKYKKLYWKNFGRLISKPVSIISLPVIGWATWNLYQWAAKNFHIELWGMINIMDIAFLILLILFITLNITTWYSVPKDKRRHPFVSAALMNGSVSGVSIYILLPNFNSTDPVKYAGLTGLVLALYIVYLIPRQIATKQTLKKASDDIREIEQMSIA